MLDIAAFFFLANQAALCKYESTKENAMTRKEIEARAWKEYREFVDAGDKTYEQVTAAWKRYEAAVKEA
jgi:hypothetical protein